MLQTKLSDELAGTADFFTEKGGFGRGEAPGFRHGEVIAPPACRSSHRVSKSIRVTVLFVNGFTTFVADSCHSSIGRGDIETA